MRTPVGHVESGQISWSDVIELADVVTSEQPVRTDPSQITLFESQGLGAWDVAVGKLVFERARAAGRGKALPF